MPSEYFAHLPQPTAERPLAGVQLLIVEDSRCTVQAVRLLALRSGARLRRADTLAHARKHLGAYLPTILIVDMGLPDGNGADLIAELAFATPRIPAIVGTSGDPGMKEAALEAGADGFLAKPIESLAAFQQGLLALLPEGFAPTGPRVLSEHRVGPDARSLEEDLELAAEILAAGDPDALAYGAQFLGTVARATHDSALADAAQSLAGHPSEVTHVAGLIADRLAQMRTSA